MPITGRRKVVKFDKHKKARLNFLNRVKSFNEH